MFRRDAITLGHCVLKLYENEKSKGENTMAEMNPKGTDKKRNITLTLSDEDSRILFEKCGYADLSVSELLENFIRDLTYSNYSNGNDEEDLANRWFERCHFGRYQDKTLLQYLHEIGAVGGFLNAVEKVEECCTELDDYYKRAEPFDEDDIESLEGNLEYWKEQRDYYKSEFLKENPEADIQEEIQKVKAWWTQREQFMEGNEEQEAELQSRQRGRLR